MAAQSPLERELQLKSDALENSLNGFDIVDSEGLFVYANRAYLDMWGFERLEEIVGTSPVQHCADPAVPLRIIGQLKAKGECTLEFVARRKDGSTFDVRMWARLAHDPEGREIYPTTSIDITEEKRAARTARLLSEATQAFIDEVELEKALPRLARVIVPDLADACIVELLRDDSGPASLQPAVVWHRTPDKRGVADGYRTLLLGDSGSSRGAHRVVQTGKAALSANAERDDPKLTGSGIRSYLCVPLRGRGRVLGALTWIIDEGLRSFHERDLSTALLLSDRVALAVDNALLFRKAQEAVRTRDTFISICSHELKTPVSSMKLQFQAAQRQLEKKDPSVFEPKRVKARIDVVLRQLHRMSKLIDDMLDASRISTGKLALELHDLDLGELVQEVLERLAEQFAILNVAVSFDRPEQALEVCADRVRLEQVVTNLLTNAIKYGEGRPARLALRASEGRAELRVEDDGLGIAPEDVERIFKRFERVGSVSNVGGLGLGLYISREIVDAHGGEIRVESVPGSGTIFVVTLPLAATLPTSTDGPRRT